EVALDLPPQRDRSIVVDLRARRLAECLQNAFAGALDERRLTELEAEIEDRFGDLGRHGIDDREEELLSGLGLGLRGARDPPDERARSSRVALEETLRDRARGR